MTDRLKALQDKLSNLTDVQIDSAISDARRETHIDSEYYSQLRELVDSNDLLYVATDHKYYSYDSHNDRWNKFTQSALTFMCPVLKSEKAQAALSELMKAEGRIYKSAAYSFSECGKNTLNFMRKDGWVKLDCVPAGTQSTNVRIQTDLTAITKVLESFGPGQEYIKRAIVQKYLHPERPQPPIVLSGPLNPLLDLMEMLNVIFNKQTISIPFRSRLNSVDELTVGKTVVMIYSIELEGTGGTWLSRSIKRLVTTVTQKDIKILMGKRVQRTSLPMKIDNTALYMLHVLSQNVIAALRVLRMFSFVSIEDTEGSLGSSEDSAQAAVLSDPQRVSEWLSVIVKHNYTSRLRPTSFIAAL